MKKKRFSVEQMIGVLKQAEVGVPVAEVIRKAGISEQTFYRWKHRFAGVGFAELRRLNNLKKKTASSIRSLYGCPKATQVDNGPEFAGKGLDAWAGCRGVELDFVGLERWRMEDNTERPHTSL